MSDCRPPDGHWHRRTGEPVATKNVGRHGLVSKFGCTEKGCEWAVYESPTGATWYPERWNQLTPLGKTQKGFAENHDPKKQAKARKMLAAAETVSGLMPEDPEDDKGSKL